MNRVLAGISKRLRRALERAANRVGLFQEGVRARKRLHAFVLLGLALVSLAGALRVEIDNRVESWTRDARTEVDAFEGSPRDFIAIIRSDVDARSAGFLESDEKISTALGAVKGGRGVESISNVLARTGRRDIDALGDGARYFTRNLLSEDGHTAVIRLWLAPLTNRPAAVARVSEIVQEIDPSATFVGPAVFNATLDSRSRSESGRVFPAAMILALVVLAMLRRSLLEALALFAPALFAVLVFLGAVGYAGASFDFVTVNVPVIGVVIGLALGIHPLAAWAKMSRAERTNRIFLRVSRQTFPGCLLSAVTTALGFVSLAASPVTPVRSFGILAACVVLIELAMSIWMLPLVLSGLAWVRRGAKRASTVWASERLEAASRWVPLRPSTHRIARRGAALALVLSLALAVRVRVDHDPFDFFERDDPLRSAYDEATREIGGTAPLEYAVELPESVWTPAGARRLEHVTSAMEAAAGTKRTASVLDAVKLARTVIAGPPETRAPYALPASNLALLGALGAVRVLPGAHEPFVSEDGRICRVIVPLDPVPGRRFRALEDAIDRSVGTIPEVSARPFGLIHRIMRVQDQILRAQVGSLAAAAAGVSIVLGLALGSPRNALAALAANALPLALIVGALGAFHLPLDLCTSMVASVALGISVDDTAHILWGLGRERGERGGAAVVRSLAPTLTTTSIVLIVGFGALGMADFPPIARFGLLTAATLTASIVSHLVVLPAIVARPS